MVKTIIGQGLLEIARMLERRDKSQPEVPKRETFEERKRRMAEEGTFVSNVDHAAHDYSDMEKIKESVMQALDRLECDEALSILEGLEDVIAEGDEELCDLDEGKLMYLYLLAETYIRMKDGCEEDEEEVECLNNAIEAANAFFKINSEQGHPMDEEAEDIHSRLMALSDYDEEYLEELGVSINRLDAPEILEIKEEISEPDDSIHGKIKEAVKRHKSKYDDWLSDRDRNLLHEIGRSLDIETSDLLW